MRCVSRLKMLTAGFSVNTISAFREERAFIDLHSAKISHRYTCYLDSFLF